MFKVIHRRPAALSLIPCFVFRILGAGLLALSNAGAAVYFVAPSGNDANPGTRDRPFATLAKAAEMVQPGDTCQLRGGTYREVLKPQRSGAEGKPITFEAWPGERVVLSGLEKIGGWQPVSGTSAWEAPMGWDLGAGNEIFCGGRMLFEARWPHKKTGDPLNPEGAAVRMYSGKDGKSFVCDTLPGLPPDVWQGATVWMVAQDQWSSWTAPLVGYQPAERRLFYGATSGTNFKYWVLERHLPGAGKENVSTFYISGNRALLQSPGEWFYDGKAGKLLLIPPAGHAADFAGEIEAKRRDVAVDLRGLSYITVSGMEIVGATLNLNDAKHCRVENVKASYICHSRGGATTMTLPGEQGGGVMISGENNLLRDSEIAWSAGNGVTLTGQRNRVVNCYIHDCDYFGTYNDSVMMEGAENLLSHCTIARAGRDCVKADGRNDRIEFNDISQAGKICKDLGMVYTFGHDAGGTRIDHNWVHDAATRLSLGIYLDNYTRDFIVDHNVVWGTAGDAIRLNRPSDDNMIFNNTLYGSLGSSWGPWKNPVTMPGCRVINNVATLGITVKPEVQKECNLEHADLGPAEPEQIPAPPIPAAPGIALAGITPPEAGDHPSIGAYQAGAPRWTAGWDPNAHPEAVFDEAQTPLRNLLVNSSFDFARGHFAPWQNGPGSDARAENFEGVNSSPFEIKNAIQGNSLHFPPGKGEVFQDLKDLPAGQPLVLAGYVRGFDGAEVSLRFEEADGTAYAAAFPAKGDWVYGTVAIPGRAGRTAGRVVIAKEGRGDAYVDNLGLSVEMGSSH